MRVRKITLPSSLVLETPGEVLDDDEEADEIDIAAEGARLIKFSPNGKWLSVITPSSRILLVKLVVSNEDRKTKVTVGGKVLELQRQERQKSAGTLKQALHNALQTPKKGKKKRRIDEGSLEAYERTITRASFSSGGNILAVGDLSGWIDTFVVSPSTGSWVYNESGATLPKLQSAPVVLEFRPSAPSSAPPNLMITEKGLEEVAPAELVEEDRLLAITAKDHHILEFNVLQGRLSDWSRKNPPAEKLPLDFRIQKDRATGVVWELSGEKERIWVWAAAWVWMFDLRQNLPTPEGVEVPVEAAGGKRKRDAKTVGFTEKGESGAGDKILMGQSRGLVATPRKGQNQPSASASDDDDEDMLKLVRNNTKTDDEDEEEDEAGETYRERTWKQSGYDTRNKPYWKTNRYRNLMAFLPVGGRDVFMGRKWGDKLDAVEMVVVERPSWDIEMPPRFYAGGSGFGGVV